MRAMKTQITAAPARSPTTPRQRGEISRYFIRGFGPMAITTIVGALVAIPLRAGPADLAAFAAWGTGWALIVGLISSLGRWRTPAIWPILSVVPLFLHFFTSLPVPLWAPSTLLLIVLIAERRARNRSVS